MGSNPELPHLKNNPKAIFFTDFDGTITLQDSNDFMTDNIGYGAEKRKKGNKDTLAGTITFRDSFKDMMNSVTRPYPECIKYLVDNVKLDPGFKEFYQWCRKENIPVVVLSSGMIPIIRALLNALIGPDSENIDVVANTVQARPGKTLEDEGGWEIIFHDESGFGHDKSLTLRPYAQIPADSRPICFYAGDGVSDLSAARESDLLFAKEGRDLVTYCAREDIPFTVFSDFSDIHKKVEEIVSGKTSVKDAAQQGYELYKAGKAGVQPA